MCMCVCVREKVKERVCARGNEWVGCQGREVDLNEHSYFTSITHTHTSKTKLLLLYYNTSSFFYGSSSFPWWIESKERLRKIFIITLFVPPAPLHHRTAIGSGVSPALMASDDAHTHNFQLHLYAVGRQGHTKLLTEQLLSLSPSPPQKARMPLICKSLKSMTNVHWKFRSVPLESVCKVSHSRPFLPRYTAVLC